MSKMCPDGGRMAWFRHGLAWILFVLCIAGNIGFAQPVSSPADIARAEGLTQALVALNTRLQRARPSERAPLLDELLDLAIERHELLASLIENDPAAVLRVALPDHLQVGMPTQVRAFLEEKIELEGTLEVLYEDYEDSARLVHNLDSFGERFSLHFAGKVPELLSGAEVRARGYVLWTGTGSDAEPSGVMALESEENVETLACCNGGTSSSSVSALPYTFGEQRTLVLLVNFQDDPSNQPWTLDQTHSLVFGTMSDFFLENSFGQTWLTGDVYGWYTTSVSSSNCDYNQIANDANAAASADGADISSYDRFIYLFPKTSACYWSGLGQVGGKPSKSWINGYLMLKVIAHEFGHNLGLRHAHGLECGASTLGSNCSSIVYGNSMDTMGSPSSGHFNGFMKERLGWLDSNHIDHANVAGTYILESYELLPGSNPKVLKVLKSTDPNTGQRTWYYLEYRQAIGFDSFLSNWEPNVVNGVVVHTGTESDGDSSYLLDMVPDNDSLPAIDWRVVALEGGASFSDPDAGVTIATDWTDSTGATVTVSFGAQNCVRADPSVTLSPGESQWVLPGALASYTVTVTNRDSSVCAAADFDLSASVPFDWSASFVNASLTLEPGTSGATTLEVTTAASAPDGFYDVVVTSTHGAAPSHSGVASATYVVSANPANQPPVAVDDSATTLQETAIEITVLDNDFDPDNDPISVTAATNGANGTVSVSGNGVVTYTPDRRFKGDDSFSYWISDGTNTTSATVLVTVEKAAGGNGGSGNGGGGKGKP